MNIFAIIAFALWALFMGFLPKILEFIRLKRWADTIPGPTIGELIETAKKGQIIAWFVELRQRYGPTFRIWFGKDLSVLFTDPEDIKQILSSNVLIHKSNTYKIVKPWLGDGLFMAGGESWHARRKMLTPAFHFQILSKFKEPIEENCKILVRKLEEKTNGEAFDVYPYLTLFALDVICETAMGIKKNTQLQSESEYVKAVDTICRVLYKKSFSFWQRHNIFFKYTKAGREGEAALKVLHGETNRVIKLRRKMLQDKNIHTEGNVATSSDIEGKQRLPFLDMLLIAQMEGNPITDQEVREEVDMFMFAGHDTTSSTLGFATYLLSQHSKVQQQAYEEAVSLEGHEKGPMPYLEAIIKETLRIYPPVPVYTRSVKEDLNVGSLTVPKGASVSILSYMVHRNETCFPEPEKFDPTRFLHNEKELHPFSFVAFSAGPRNCIGQKFAMLEMKCALSSLLRNFEFLPVLGFKPKIFTEFVLKSENGIKIRIKSRN